MPAEGAVDPYLKDIQFFVFEKPKTVTVEGTVRFYDGA